MEIGRTGEENAVRDGYVLPARRSAPDPQHGSRVHHSSAVSVVQSPTLCVIRWGSADVWCFWDLIFTPTLTLFKISSQLLEEKHGWQFQHR